MKSNPKTTYTKRIPRILFLLYCFAIILLTVLPIDGESSSLNNTYFVTIRLDYLLHSLVFLPFLPLATYSISITSGNLKPTIRIPLLIIIGILFAIITEVIQHFLPYRTFNINDLIANTLGVLLGFLPILLIKNNLKFLKTLIDTLNSNSNKGTIFRIVWFILLYIISRYLFNFLEDTQLFSTIFNFFYNLLSILIAYICTTTLSLFYQEILSTSDFIIQIRSINIIQLLPGCTGFHQLLRITFILLFFPIPYRKKLILLPLSWSLIIFAAVIHFLMLIPIAFDLNEWYDFSHNWPSKFVFYLFFFINFLIWEKQIMNKKTIKVDN